MADGFKFRHNRLYVTIVSCLEHYPGNKWSMIESLDTYNAARGKCGVLTLVTRDGLAREEIRSTAFVLGSNSSKV